MPIISASRRTDIPAWYARWFMNRVRAGFCDVPNPFNPRQVSRVSLRPADVPAVVFWTRDPGPILEDLPELDDRGLPSVFLFTLLDYPRTIDPGTAPLEKRLDRFRRLADAVGPDRVIWRYDPIYLSPATDPDFHRRRFARLADALAGRTRRCVVSFLDVYRKMEKRLAALAGQGLQPVEPGPEMIAPLIRDMIAAAEHHGIGLTSCAETRDLRSLGIRPGRCIDAEYLSRIFDLHLPHRKDPSQRKTCGCSVSKDIGMYDTCPAGCVYCYATRNINQARQRHQTHDPNGPSLYSRRVFDLSESVSLYRM